MMHSTALFALLAQALLVSAFHVQLNIRHDRQRRDVQFVLSLKTNTTYNNQVCLHSYGFMGRFQQSLLVDDDSQKRTLLFVGTAQSQTLFEEEKTSSIFPIPMTSSSEGSPCSDRTKLSLFSLLYHRIPDSSSLAVAIRQHDPMAGDAIFDLFYYDLNHNSVTIEEKYATSITVSTNSENRPFFIWNLLHTLGLALIGAAIVDTILVYLYKVIFGYDLDEEEVGYEPLLPVVASGGEKEKMILNGLVDERSLMKKTVSFQL